MGEGKGLADRVVRYIINCKPLDFACLNVNEIARRFGVSVPHLSRTFKTAKGMGLREFISREKINCSRFLLQQDEELSVKDVAAALDFCSTDYFIRVFKKQFGVTPGRCRKIDNGFFGLKDRRNGCRNRRIGPEDRRKLSGFNQELKLSLSTGLELNPARKERRRGSQDRRKRIQDRRNHPQKSFS